MLTLAWLLACTGPEDSGEPGPSCAEGELLDGLSCVPEACGVGVFGDRDGDIFVDPLNLGEQEGSREHPWATLDEALSHIRPDETVVLAAGRYKGLVRSDLAPRGVKILGRCKELSVLDAEGDTVVVYGVDTGTHLEQLTITGGEEAGVFAFSEHVVLRDIDLVAPGYVGVWIAERGSATLERVRVAHTLIDPDYDSAWGVVVTDHSDMQLDDVVIEHTIDAGLFLEGAGRVQARNLRIHDVSARSDGSGTGIIATGGDLLTVEGCVITDTHLAGVFLEPGATAVVEDCWIEGVATPIAESYAAGVYAVEADLTVRESVLKDIEGTGAEVFGSNATLTLEDVRIEHTFVDNEAYANGFGLTVRQGLMVATRVDLVDTMAIGVWVSDGGQAELTDVRIEGVTEGPSFSATAGIYAREGGQVRMQQVEVRDLLGNGLAVTTGGHIEGSVLVEAIRPADAKGTGHCVDLSEGTAALWDSTLRDCREVALVAGAGSQATLTDSLIEDIGTTGTYALGLGLLAQSDGFIEATGVTLRRTASSAVAATEGGRVVLDEVSIEQSWLNDAFDNGYALYAPAGGLIEARALTLRGAGGVGALASGEGSHILLVDTLIERVYRSTGAGTAFGLLVQDHASAALSRVLFQDIEGPGMACSSGASLEAEEIEVLGAHFAGVVLQGCEATLTSVSVEGVAADPDSGGGLGFYLDGLGHGPNQVVGTLLRALDNPFGGLLAVGEGHLTLDGRFAGSEGVPLANHTLMGHAVAALDCSDLTLSGRLTEGRSGLFLSACDPTLGALEFQGNEVDLHHQACEGEPVSVPEGATATLCPSHDELVIDLRFDATLEEAALEP